MLEEAIFPLLEVLKRLLASKIKAEGAAIGSFVESIPNGLVFLLTRGIPYLHSHDGVIDHYLLLLEIGSDSWLGVLRVLTLGISH